jgi:hypothetical protein
MPPQGKLLRSRRIELHRSLPKLVSIIIHEIGALPLSSVGYLRVPGANKIEFIARFNFPACTKIL